MTEPLVVPPHYHEFEETVVVLSGTLRFWVGPLVDEYKPESEPYEGVEPVDCGPEQTMQVPARAIHGYQIVGRPARVLIFMPDPEGLTLMPDGTPLPLPWES
jgi:quercetin dioxygenase-like cupin family protein